MITEIVLCSQNQGKVKDFSLLLSDLGVVVHPATDFSYEEPVEDAGTFLGNALIKVNFLYSVSGKPCLADDSGLVVPALGGDPGVESAYYAGSVGSRSERDLANNLKLAQAVAGLSQQERYGFFHCSLVLRTSESHFIEFIGKCEGTILTVPYGQDGFGYDSMFYHNQMGKSLAEMNANEKNTVSARADAVRQLKAYLQSLR